VTDPIEETARRIAELGNAALLRRLRPAFDHAAVTYASRITIRNDELEQMLEQAARRADAAIWRGALATVAIDELHIGLSEALEHPAVIRAQEIVGAPALDRAVFTAAPETSAEALPEREALPETEALPEAVPETPAQPDELDARPEPEPPRDGSPPVESGLAPQTIRLTAVHLGGIESLPRGGKYLELCFSDAGLDVVDAEGGDVIGRLRWDEIDALELPSGRNSLGRRRRRAHTQLVVRADRGEASFEIQGLADVELREHLAPIMARVRGARSRRQI
jgi:hypothetical protein